MPSSPETSNLPTRTNEVDSAWDSLQGYPSATTLEEHSAPSQESIQTSAHDICPGDLPLSPSDEFFIPRSDYPPEFADYMSGDEITLNERFEMLFDYYVDSSLFKPSPALITSWTPEFQNAFWDSLYGAAVEDYLSHQQIKEYRTEHPEIYDRVNLQDIATEYSPFLERVNPDEIDKLAHLINTNHQLGLELTTAYFSDIFQLPETPACKCMPATKDSPLASYSEKSNTIIYYLDAAKPIEPYDLILNGAHETVHAHQWHLSQDEANERGRLYKYNSEHYISSSTDYDAYRTQLIEAEASSFEAALTAKLKERNQSAKS